MLQTDRGHVAPCQKLALLVKLLLAPVQRLRSDLFVHDHAALPLCEAEQRVGTAGFLIDRDQETLVIVHIFACKKLVKIFWDLAD